MLRMAAGRNPDDPELAALEGELSVHSSIFRQYWNKHHVYEKSTGMTQLCHPEVGEVEVKFIAWRTRATPNQILVTYTPEPGSPSAHAVDLLRSMIATHRR
jgi:hypothetical protein